MSGFPKPVSRRHPRGISGIRVYLPPPRSGELMTKDNYDVFMISFHTDPVQTSTYFRRKWNRFPDTHKHYSAIIGHPDSAGVT
jgi:hypothetical protein